MGWTDLARKAYDPVTGMNLNLISIGNWTPENERYHKKILKLIGLRPGWKRGAPKDVGLRPLLLLVAERRPGSIPFLRKVLKSLREEYAARQASR